MKIRLSNVCKAFGDQIVLDNLNLTVEPNRITVIIGESGGGKSVLLKHIIGLIKPDAGAVYVDDVEISALNERRLNEKDKISVDKMRVQDYKNLCGDGRGNNKKAVDTAVLWITLRFSPSYPQDLDNLHGFRLPTVSTTSTTYSIHCC